ncbi:hypothetical protein GW17_00019972, partial [Ensete ventricosum]
DCCRRSHSSTGPAALQLRVYRNMKERPFPQPLLGGLDSVAQPRCGSHSVRYAGDYITQQTLQG